jgi:4-amino-4-deoxy-L-arabinose transferase-like glycosyltransferase
MMSRTRITDIRKLPKRILAATLLVLLVTTVILASVPPVLKDELVHHLAIPKLYLEHGSIYEMPGLEFSYYPMNIDLLYILPLFFGNDIVPKYIHLLFGVLTAWLIFRYIAKWLSLTWALAGACLFLSVPIIVKLSTSAYVDLGLLFFLSLALFMLLEWSTSGFQTRYLLLSAVGCGLALGTKYNGLIGLILLLSLVPMVYLAVYRSSHNAHTVNTLLCKSSMQYRAIAFAALYLVIALTLFSPWLIRNYIWTNNPVYPLFDHVFNPDNPFDNALQVTSLNPFLMRKLVYNESFWQTLLVPVRIFFTGQDGNPVLFDGKLAPYLILLPGLAFLSIKKDPPQLQMSKKILIGFAFIFLIIVFLQRDMRIRYILPIIPPLSVLSVFGLFNLIKSIEKLKPGRKRQLCGTGLAVAVILFAGLNISYVVMLYKKTAPLEYLSGKVTRDEYITRFRPEYQALTYANTHLPEDAKLLALYLGKRGYYSNRAIQFDQEIFHRALVKATSVEESVRFLLEKGFTHLILRHDMFLDWVKRSFQPKENQLVQILFSQHLQKLYTGNGHTVFAIKG